MGRSTRCRAEIRKPPYSTQRPRGRPPRAARISNTTAATIDGSLLNCESSADGERLTFHLRNNTSYTISPAVSSPEHFWGTIYSAEWFHPHSGRISNCAIKASDFLLRQTDTDDSRAEYRRPRRDFDREVRTFQIMKHRNVLRMYDFWEWKGKGYIAMKRMKGSLGDILYESEYRDIVDVLRSNESVLAELARQVNSPIIVLFINSRF
jgi:hypothetical protein